MADNLQGNLESTADSPVNNPELTANNSVNNPELTANNSVNNSELTANNSVNNSESTANNVQDVEIFEKIAISQFFQKYSIGRTQFYDRTKYLNITCWKISGKAYLDSEQAAHMDGLHEHIKEHGRMDGYPVPESSGPLKASEMVEPETQSAIVVQEEKQSLQEPEPHYVETKAYSNTPVDDIAKVARRGAERVAAMIAGEDAVVSYLLENPEQLPADLRATVEASRARLDLASQLRQEQYNPDFFRPNGDRVSTEQSVKQLIFDLASMALISAIIAANGFSLVSLVATVCGSLLWILRGGFAKAQLPKLSKRLEHNAKSTSTPSSTTPAAEPQSTTFTNKRLYRQNELNRIVAALLANGSILVAGEEGSGKSILANAVVDKLLDDEYLVAKVEPATTKQMLLDIAQQLEIETHSLEGKALSADHLKIKIADFLKENTAFLIVDDCHNCDARFRTWLKFLNRLEVPIAVFATNPPKTDIFSSLPPLILHPLSEYAIREIMEQAALARGLNLKNSDLARLQERAGGNPMLAERAINEEYLGLEVEAADHNQYVDATPMILVAGICFMVLRFIGRGTDDRMLYLISGIGGVVFMGFSRMFYNLPPDSRRIMR